MHYPWHAIDIENGIWYLSTNNEIIVRGKASIYDEMIGEYQNERQDYNKLIDPISLIHHKIDYID